MERMPTAAARVNAHGGIGVLGSASRRQVILAGKAVRMVIGRRVAGARYLFCAASIPSRKMATLSQR